MTAFIIYILYFWILYLYFNCLFIPKKISKFRKFLIWGLFFFIQIIGLTQFNQLIPSFFANCILIILLCYSLYHSSIKKIIFTAIGGCVIGMLIEIFVAIIFQLLGFSVSETAFAGAVISKLILLTLVHALNILKFQHSSNNPSLFYWMLLLLMSLSSIIIIHTLFLFNQSSTLSSHINLSTLAIFLLFVINIGFFLLYNKLSFTSDLQIKNLIMLHQLKHYEELRSNRNAQANFLRREKHNLKNQLIAIRAYALQGQTSQIIDFVNTLITNTNFGLNDLTICNNIILDTLIDGKINIAKEHDITYTWDILVPEHLPFDDIDLCILVGNAIDNAFDACMSNSHFDNKFVDITIHYKNECLYCNFSNSYSHKLITSSQNHFLSTKSNFRQHGYGIPSIQYVVNKYSGLLEATPQDNIFILKILLYKH